MYFDIFKIWKDHVVKNPNRNKVTDLGNGYSDVVPAPGEVVQQGDPLNAENFNRMESGILDVSLAVQFVITQIQHMMTYAKKMHDDFTNEFLNEIGNVTLSNTSVYPFNSSGATISMKKARKTMNYDITYEITSSDGIVSDVIIYDKQLNGFKLRFEGSAKSVTIQYRIKGGMLK